MANYTLGLSPQSTNEPHPISRLLIVHIESECTLFDHIWEFNGNHTWNTDVLGIEDQGETFPISGTAMIRERRRNTAKFLKAVNKFSVEKDTGRNFFFSCLAVERKRFPKKDVWMHFSWVKIVFF